MPVRIVVRDGESLEDALARLRSVMYRLRTRRWHRRRYGYHEKPSALRRKAWKMRRVGGRGREGPELKIELPKLLARTGPTNAAGR